MSRYEKAISRLMLPETQSYLTRLYGAQEISRQTARYTDLLKTHEALFHSDAPISMISAPGRAEIGGNHTDHNRGKVLAAAVNLDALAVVAPREDATVRLCSEGYAPLTISLEDLSIRPEERNTTASLIRGVAFRMRELGYRIGGFDVAVHSTVLSGSGLSSSAAIEVLLCAVFDHLYNGDALPQKLRAQISQYAENVYFGKPSGLLDQMASSVGGLTSIDFEMDDPKVRALSYDFEKKGYALAVVATGGSHDDLTPNYAAIPAEMRAVAAFFGKSQLREVSETAFFAEAESLRKHLKAQGVNADRAMLRAWHFFSENRRVDGEVEALEKDDLPAFLHLIKESGRSSFCYLQNIYPNVSRQEQSLGLMLAESLLSDDGAWRVHGGGFAGTTLNFVPHGKLDEFVARMESVFGTGSCTVLTVRPEGPSFLSLE